MQAISRRGSIIAGAVLVSVLAAGPAQAQVYFGELTGAEEVPPVASPGMGIARVTLNGNFMNVEAVFANLLAPTVAAHIHCCAPFGTNVGVATTLPSFPGFPLGVTAGVYERLFDLTLASSYGGGFLTAHGGDPLQARDALVAGLNAGTSYFNIHTTQFPGGEIRGQLFQQTQVVPEPASMALLLTGLAGLGAARRRRRKAAAPEV